MLYELKEKVNGKLIEVHSHSMESLFALACNGWRDAVIPGSDCCSIDEREISLRCADKESALLALLTGLNDLLNNESWLFNSVETVEISEGEDFVDIHALLLGEPFDGTTHQTENMISSIYVNKILAGNSGSEFRVEIEISTASDSASKSF